ncbi:DUF1700 domain-containing protein [Clostridium vincentii]|uniref:DUF1700 domain-containing protein n=1 Tax=Clostridium vincentii TaxID=52704 RepID=A0A2T0BKJ6_9CLOT|nr:DUF1700 domain-containing protein [Clostridium vincentii]PRR84395.1 hypothetical protein CLVI_03210 [Clostridium vincentii]
MVNKNEFLKIIRAGLNDFPPEELNEIIAGYENHFKDALSDGKTEEEIINIFGDPFVIVNQYRNGYVQSVPPYKSSNTNYSNNSHKNNNNSYTNDSQKNLNSDSNNVNTLLKITIVILTIVIIGPFGLAIGGSLFALALAFILIPFALSLSGIALLFVQSGLSLFGFTAPTFLADFPTSVIALITVGSTFATILVTILSVYFIKAVIIFARKLFNKFFNKEAN